VTNQVAQAPAGANGAAATALVTNSGTILANGGTVQLTARAADASCRTWCGPAARSARRASAARPARFALNAIGGSIVVEGQLAATGTHPARPRCRQVLATAT